MSDLYYQRGAGDADDRATASERPPGAFLTLGHVLAGIGAEQSPPIGLHDIHLIRHSFKTGDANGLRGPEDLTEERVREYTRAQGISTRQFPAEPARYWVILIADGQRRSRLYGTFENLGGSTDVVVGHFRPGSAGQRPPRVSMAMAIRASGLWNP